MLRPTHFDDPFFVHHEQMRQMGQMAPMAQVFPMTMGQGMGMGGMLAIPQHSRQHQLQQQQLAQNMQIANQGMFMDPFAHFNSMFSNMQNMMTDMRGAFSGGNVIGGGDPGGHMYQQSSFTSYTNTGSGGTPRYYQSSSSSRRGPDGVMETKNTERDSESGVNKIAVGHHIRDRGHVIERSRNSRTGEMNENQDYVNLDEEEAQHFEQEYHDKWRSAVRGVEHGGRRPDAVHAITAGPTRSRYAALPEAEHRRHRKNRKE